MKRFALPRLGGNMHCFLGSIGGKCLLFESTLAAKSSPFVHSDNSWCLQSNTRFINEALKQSAGPCKKATWHNIMMLLV
eukprot:2615762-Pleurochrysis_carterae.AAC.5